MANSIFEEDLATGALLAKGGLPAMAYASGAQLGRGIGGLFGVEDPRVTEERELREAASEINLKDPQGLYKFAQLRLKYGDYDGALKAFEQGRLLEAARIESAAGSKEPSDIREARIRAKSIRNDMLRSGMQNPPSLEELEDRLISMEASATGLIDYRQQLYNEYGIPPAIGGQSTVQEQQLRNLTIPEYDTAIDKLYSEMQGMSEQQKENVRQQIADLSDRKKSLSETLKTMDSAYESMIKPDKSKLKELDINRELVKQVREGNPQAFGQLRRFLTKFVGDSQIGQNEISQTTRAGDIILRFSDWASENLVGTPTEQTINNIENLFDGLNEVYNKRLAENINNVRSRYELRGVPKAYLDQEFSLKDDVVKSSPKNKRETIPINSISATELSRFVVDKPYEMDGVIYIYKGLDEDGNPYWESK